MLESVTERQRRHVDMMSRNLYSLSQLSSHLRVAGIVVMAPHGLLAKPRDEPSRAICSRRKGEPEHFT